MATYTLKFYIRKQNVKGQFLDINIFFWKNITVNTGGSFSETYSEEGFDSVTFALSNVTGNEPIIKDHGGIWIQDMPRWTATFEVQNIVEASGNGSYYNLYWNNELIVSNRIPSYTLTNVYWGSSYQIDAYCKSGYSLVVSSGSGGSGKLIDTFTFSESQKGQYGKIIMIWFKSQNNEIYAKTSSGWKNGDVYIKTNGAWQRAGATYRKTNGTWKQIKG